MSVWEYRDYYKRQYDEASRLMIAQPEGPMRDSAEQAVAYFGYQAGKYTALCQLEKEHERTNHQTPENSDPLS